MPKIKKIQAREVLDSMGNPTIEANVILDDGVAARSGAPVGQSKGTYEAAELRDGDQNRYNGQGVLNAVKNINELIGPALTGMDALNQQKIDKAMIDLDGTQNKSKLGANAIISVSQAVMKAAAQSSVLPTPVYIRQFLSGNLGKKLPVPMFNMVEGGKHGGDLNFQEFMVVPASSKSYSEGLEIGTKVYHTLSQMIYERGQIASSAVGGGFSPTLANNQAGIALVKEAIEKSGYTFCLDAFIGIDAAANSFNNGKEYRLKDRAMPYTSDDLVELYKDLFSEFSLMYIEDPFAEDDWEGWKKMYQALGDKTIIAGDDLVATNPYRLQLALDNKVSNGVVIKPNQIGTVTEAIAVVEIARYTGLKIIVSHRGAETLDPFIAEFAVGVAADYVKFGAPARERVSKYNKLLEIESELSAI